MDLQSLKSWGAESVQAVRKEGLSGLDSVWRPVYYKLLHQVERFQDPGVLIYDLDWDVCIILDACRYDLMTEVADEYEFLETVEQRRSPPGSHSTELGRHTPDTEDRTADPPARERPELSFALRAAGWI